MKVFVSSLIAGMSDIRIAARNHGHDAASCAYHG